MTLTGLILAFLLALLLIQFAPIEGGASHRKDPALAAWACQPHGGFSHWTGGGKTSLRINCNDGARFREAAVREERESWERLHRENKVRK